MIMHIPRLNKKTASTNSENSNGRSSAIVFSKNLLQPYKLLILLSISIKYYITPGWLSSTMIIKVVSCSSSSSSTRSSGVVVVVVVVALNYYKRTTKKENL